MTPQTTLTDEEIGRIRDYYERYHEYEAMWSGIVNNTPLLLAHIATLQQQVRDERERCAKVAEQFIAPMHGMDTRTMHSNSAAKSIAAAIRGGTHVTRCIAPCQTFCIPNKNAWPLSLIGRGM